MNWAIALLFILAAGLAQIRWLRVAQREHYAAGRVVVFALRWSRAGRVNELLIAGAVLGALLAWVPSGRLAGVVIACVAVAVAPVGLGLRGRTAPLVWSRRMRVLAAVVGVIEVGIAALVVLQPAVAGLAAVAQPLVLDLALAITGPLERLASEKWVRQAAQRLLRVEPTIVGITGSYGKTTVKNYAAHLLGRKMVTLASRKSFNNRLGLARSINTDLAPGTDVFVAEMGTYGPGEIARMCSWCPPSVAAITAIGPVHLERMGSLDAILEAKSEILERAAVAVLNVDDDRLRGLADRIAARGQRVVRCGSSTAEDVDVRVQLRDGTLIVEYGEHRIEARRPAGAVVDTNVAIAVGISVALDAVPHDLAAALATLPEVENRLTTVSTPDGPTIVDDTYNSNPAGARVALRHLAQLLRDEQSADGVVITPGMVELGDRQHDDNAEFAASVAELGATLVAVGRTNEAPLVEGYLANGGGKLVQVDDRDEAVAWLRENGSPNTVVLFENDLPDHFP